MAMESGLGKESLDQVGLRFGTDKASSRHDFLRHYERILHPLVDREFTLLELGVGPVNNIGKSLFMWREFFPRASVVGIDDKIASKSVEGERIRIEIGDLGQIEFLRDLAAKYRPLVIIDDASHIWSHQILALEMLYGSLEPAGHYIVEDLHTSFGKLAERFGHGQYQDTATYLATVSTLVCGGSQASHGSYLNVRPSPMQWAIAERTDTVTVCRHTAILTKKALRRSRPEQRPTVTEPISTKNRGLKLPEDAILEVGLNPFFK